MENVAIDYNRSREEAIDAKQMQQLAMVRELNLINCLDEVKVRRLVKTHTHVPIVRSNCSQSYWTLFTEDIKKKKPASIYQVPNIGASTSQQALVYFSMLLANRR